MPDREIERLRQTVTGGLQGAADRQLKRREHGEMARATLATQRAFREVDQLLMQEMNQAFADRNPNMPIGTGLLSEDNRQARMDQLIDEKLQEIRQGVTTPAGQMQYEATAEQMRQQFHHSWEDKARAAEQAWEAAIWPDERQGWIDEASWETAEQTEAMIQMRTNQMVANGSMSHAEQIHELKESNKILYDTLSRRFINNPVDENGDPIQNLFEGHAASNERIESLRSNEKINETHMHQLKEFNSAVLEARQIQERDGIEMAVNSDMRLHLHGRGALPALRL